MSRLLSRLRKLEAQLKDDAGLVPNSPEWLDYWTRRIDAILIGEVTGAGLHPPGGYRCRSRRTTRTMRTITRRLLRLEARFIPQPDGEPDGRAQQRLLEKVERVALRLEAGRTPGEQHPTVEEVLEMLRTRLAVLGSPVRTSP